MAWWKRDKDKSHAGDVPHILPPELDERQIRIRANQVKHWLKSEDPKNKGVSFYGRLVDAVMESPVLMREMESLPEDVRKAKISPLLPIAASIVDNAIWKFTSAVSEEGFKHNPAVPEWEYVTHKYPPEIHAMVEPYVIKEIALAQETGLTPYRGGEKLR